MNVDLYERIWMWMAAVIVLLFMSFVGVSTFGQGITAPSHVETIDPKAAFTDPRFARLGVPTELPDGTIEVQMAAIMFSFAPNEVRIPPGRRIRFRVTSGDVTHGFMIAGTNVNSMVVPMPRRVFDAAYGDHPTAVSWKLLTDVSAAGGILLFISALFVVLVVLFTLFGTKTDAGVVEFSESLEAPGPRAAIFDRLGLWTAVAIVLW